jgi:hypothetical protein
VRPSGQRFRTMRFACALPFDSQEGLGRPCVDSRRMPVAAALRNAPPRGHALPRSGSGRMPFATAFWTDSAPTSSPTPESSRLPYPWRLHESEANSKSRLLVAPSARRLRRLPDAELAPHASSTLKPTRLGSRATLAAHWKPPVATAASALGPRLRESRHAGTGASADGRTRRLELRRARSEPKHPRTRDAIRAAQTFDPTARVIDVAADGDPAPSLGGDQIVEEACSTGLRATP